LPANRTQHFSIRFTMSHRVQKDWKGKLKSAVPFGLGQTKPQHFRDMARMVWKNRDNLGYAWKVLSQGVCDGCALGVAGFHDWTIQGVHLCMTRLNLLRLNTMPALDISRLENIDELRRSLAGRNAEGQRRDSPARRAPSRKNHDSLDNAQLRELGRLALPHASRTRRGRFPPHHLGGGLLSHRPSDSGNGPQAARLLSDVAGRDAVFMNPDDAANLHLKNEDPVALVNDLGRLEGRAFLAPMARGNLQVHWPEGNVLIRRGFTDALGGVPDYNAQVEVERLFTG
jgi:hypothetical protein